jgi:hypothetical protein
MGQVVKTLASVGLAPVTGGASLLGIGEQKAPKAPRLIERKKVEQTIQPAKSRAARLAASRGRRSFRVSLGTTGDAAGPRATRSGIAIG